ncbi:hypothetical protein GCM10023081_08330 [Arthrobacter ginkgonis]|uniref:Uncharacterized protein n=1 Tax=Arthrobacter ginkgonis TaxID=1630594 RepID=A0ABP7BX04_9MICC
MKNGPRAAGRAGAIPAPDRRQLLASGSGQIAVVEHHERLVLLARTEQLGEVQVDIAPRVIEEDSFPLVGTNDERDDGSVGLTDLDPAGADLSHGALASQRVQENLPLRIPAGWHRPSRAGPQRSSGAAPVAFDMPAGGDFHLARHDWSVCRGIRIAAHLPPLRSGGEPERARLRHAPPVRTRRKRQPELDVELRPEFPVGDPHRFHPDVPTKAVVAVKPVIGLPVRIIGIDSRGMRVCQDGEQSPGVRVILHGAHHPRLGGLPAWAATAKREVPS